MFLRGSLLLTLLWIAPLFADASVAARHVAPNATFTSGILRVERFGKRDGRSIVFIPALFCGSWQWNAQINALAGHYDVLVVTLPGFDGLPMVNGDSLMERAAQSLHLLIVTHHLKRPIVVGHSLGGSLAVYFGENYPRDATDIVTIEGGYPSAPTQAARDAAVARSTAPYEKATKNDVGATIRENTLQYTITSRADVNAVEPLAARSDPAAIAAWLRAALSLDLTPGLSKIAVPFTVIIPFDPLIDPFQGYKTSTAKRAAYVAWAAHATSGEVIVVEPSRHFVMFDQPGKFESALETAIAR
jgi:pimeloyl-ACP methyl ester carboxylesterase